MATKTNIQVPIKKKQSKIEKAHPLPTPLSYWQEQYPGWTGLELLDDPKYNTLPEGDDWKGPGWDAMVDMFIDLLLPLVQASVKAREAQDANRDWDSCSNHNFTVSQYLLQPALSLGYYTQQKAAGNTKDKFPSTKHWKEAMEDDRSNTILTVEEVAQRWSVHIETVRRWIRSGALQAIDLGGPAGYRIRQAELDRFIREHLTKEKGESMANVETAVDYEVRVAEFFEKRGIGRDNNGVERPMLYVRFVGQSVDQVRPSYFIGRDQTGIILLSSSGVNQQPIFHPWTVIDSIW